MMDVLEMVLPGTLSQKIDQRQSLRASVLESKCSSKWSTVGCISTPRVARKNEHTSSPNSKSKENLRRHGTSQQSYDDVSGISSYLSLDASGANVTSRLSLDSKGVDKPVKKIKKKNKKKGKNYANLSENVSADTGSTECAKNIAIVTSQSSKEGENEKDDIAIANHGEQSDLTGTRVLSDVVNKPRSNYNFQTGKESGHSISQKSRKSSRDAPTHWVKRSNIHVQKDVKLQGEDVLVKHNSFSSNALLPSHMVSARHDIAAQGVEEVLKSKQVMYCRSHTNVMAEFSRGTAQRFHGGLIQYDSESVQDDIVGITDWRKVKGTLNQSFKQKNINNRKQNVGGYKANVFRLQDRMIAPRKDAPDVSGEPRLCNKSADAQRSISDNQYTENDESDGLHLCHPSANSQLNLPLATIPDLPGQAVLPDTQSFKLMKISTVEQVLVGTPPISVDKRQRDPARLDINLCLEDNIKKDYTSQAGLRKWIPIAKNSRMLKSLGSLSACNELKSTSNLCKDKAEVHLEDYKICGFEPVAPVDSGNACLMSDQELPILMTTKIETPQLHGICHKVEDNHSKGSIGDYVTPGNKAKSTSLLDLGSLSAVEALDAAYRLQMASESVQLATGSPLAEFERLVHSATPVIVPAFVLEDCNVCWGNQLSHSRLCKHQIPNIPISAVWNWYEKPGNYGLEVKAQDFRNSKGFDTDSVSFKAHFVPFLSAVQLFGCRHLSGCSSQIQHNFERQEIRNGEQCSTSLKTSMDKPCHGVEELDPAKGEGTSATVLFKSGMGTMSSSDIFPAAGDDSFGSSSTPTCSDNMELIFEFFEHEQPQQRKPLYDKVKELVKAGGSSYKVRGDPSNLECMNLHDLHPASWYSVAWYPIYRIPEGNLRASFLTYHSLGHLVQRCSVDSPEKQFSVVSPVLGLQSYNTQGECWFCPKKRSDYSKGCTTFNSSEILKERLSTLEKSALLFARGCIYKDHIKVTNRQPDYEFFLSRKR